MEIGHKTKQYPDSQKSVYSNFHEFKKGEPAKLSDEHVKDLRAHHFKLGHMKYGPDLKTNKTEQKDTYFQKSQIHDLKPEYDKTKQNAMAAVSLIFIKFSQNFLMININTTNHHMQDTSTTNQD